jgi:uncharacterized protein YvpB
MILGFTGIYMGLLAVDYITMKNQTTSDSNFAVLAKSEDSYRLLEDKLATETPDNTAEYNTQEENAISGIDQVVLADNPTTEASSTASPILNTAESNMSETQNSAVKPVIQKAKETLLKVPIYVQEFKNSCEAASLRMALAYKNIQASGDMELIQKFGYSPIRKDVTNNIWGDPQKEFVGFVDERCSECGYGVYGIPVTKTARSYGVNAIYLTDVIPSVLAEELFQNNPIIAWGYTSLSTPYTWNTPTGGTVKAFKGLHARVLVGFRGEKENPKGFYLNDPLTGKQEFWNTASLVSHMNAAPGVTNQMVVIR